MPKKLGTRFLKFCLVAEIWFFSRLGYVNYCNMGGGLYVCVIAFVARWGFLYFLAKNAYQLNLLTFKVRLSKLFL